MRIVIIGLVVMLSLLAVGVKSMADNFSNVVEKRIEKIEEATR